MFSGSSLWFLPLVGCEEPPDVLLFLPLVGCEEPPDVLWLAVGGSLRLFLSCGPFCLLSRNPMVTGTSVLGVKFTGGVVIAADMLGSYGSLARFRNVSRLMKVSTKPLPEDRKLQSLYPVSLTPQ